VNNLDDFPTREYFSGANLADWFRFEGWQSRCHYKPLTAPPPPVIMMSDMDCSPDYNRQHNAQGRLLMRWSKLSCLHAERLETETGLTGAWNAWGERGYFNFEPSHTLRPMLALMIFRNSVLTSQKTHYYCTTKTSLLMVYREITNNNTYTIIS
jgi:hypothetical protein